MCEVASWIPSAVSATLGDKRAAQPIIAWLFNLRASIEEYDPLVIVRPPSPDEEDSSTPDRAFDEILSQLGREIFNLDEYRKKFTPQDAEVSLSILNIFDECLDTMAEDKADLCESDTEVPVKSVVNGADDCSDCESTLSNISSLANIPVCETKDLLEQTLAKQDERPIPAPRTIIKSQSSTSVYEIVNLIKDDVNRATESDSNSVSTSWSYKECNSSEECIPNTENPNDYGALWSHSSGFHNSDKILQTVLLKNQATISRVDFETASEFTPADYNVYSLHEVGDRCDTNTNKSPVAAMPATNDDGYEPVRDAITTDENIYEEIEFGCSYTDEGCSSGGSVEVESLSMSASSEGIGRESPFYVNLRDNDAYSVPPDVKYWMRTLADPFCNEDEEDEWISPEEYTVYTRDQRPPLVIPRITQYRPPPRQSQVKHVDYQQDDVQSLLISNSARQHYDRLHDASPVAEKSMLDLEKSYIKSSGSDKSSLSRSRIFGSTENVFGAKRPTHLNLPASSSGDSLDVEFRDNRRITPAHLRNGRARSAIATKSPVPPPRIHLQPSIEASVVFETPLKRTKYFESGKKSKKNWTECYMILTHTALVFYKDYRTYQASVIFQKVQKPPGAPASPNAPRAELVLPLRNAHVVRCLQMHTKRFTKSVLLTVGYDQYLLQDDSEDGARRLLMLIQNTIFKLGPPLPEDVRSALHSQSSSTDLDSLGRTPPTSRRTKNTKQKAGGSSNEDLSDSTESSVQKSQVKSRLKKFFAKRPAMEVLVKKGIYKDEPVFGKNLEEVCPQTSPRVPDFVVACIKEIESSEENMCTDGLYRASGNLSQVQKIRLEIDQNNLSVLENSLDIHVLTGSLKLFFRELKEPVIPRNMFHRVLSACSIKPREAKIREFRDIIQSLPQCNKDTLKFLLEHLLRVTQYSEQNRMHTANLAIVFGPTLLWAPAAQAHNIAVDCIQQNNVVDILLTEFKEIFTEDNSKGKKKT